MKVSLCMIVRNEQNNLIKCLESVHSLVDEIVIVDTGSVDVTRDIAKAYTDKVYKYKWTDSFADARNFALQPVSHPWTLSLDADDILSSLTRYRLRDLFETLSTPRAYKFYINSIFPDRSDSTSKLIRLFPSYLRWKYRCHEQLDLLDLPVELVPISIDHYGYLDPAITHAKKLRNLRLLELDLEQYPTDYFVLTHLYLVHMGLGDMDKASHYLELAKHNYKSSLALV